jgi:hypothetical protein
MYFIQHCFICRPLDSTVSEDAGSDVKFRIVFVQGGPRPHIPFPPELILYVNLVATGAPKFFRTLAPWLTVLDIPFFADAYSRTVRPIDLHNF